MNPTEALDRMKELWERRNPPHLSRSVQTGLQPVEVLWSDHFKAFCAAHGGYPLVYKPLGRLLFEDGWTHALDHKGPKGPPPESEYEARKLRRNYWKVRRRAVRKHIPVVRVALEQVKAVIHQAGDVGINFRSWVANGDTGVYERI